MRTLCLFALASGFVCTAPIRSQSAPASPDDWSARLTDPKGDPRAFMSGRVRAAAGDGAARAELLAAALRDDTVFLRLVEALERADPPLDVASSEPTAVLVDRLVAPDRVAALGAAWTLGARGGSADAAAALAAAARRPGTRLAHLAMVSLRRFGPRAAPFVPGLVAALQHPDGSPCTASELLPPDGRFFPALGQALLWRPCDHSRAALLVLAGVGPEAVAAVPPLDALLAPSIVTPIGGALRSVIHRIDPDHRVWRRRLTPGLALTVEPGAGPYRLGAVPRFTVRLRNRDTAPWTLALPGDGSTSGSRNPLIAWHAEPLDDHHAPLPLRGFASVDDPERRLSCDTINPIREAEVVDLAPGRELALGQWMGAPSFSTAGRHAVWVEYQLDPQLVADNAGAHEQAALDRLARARACRVVSNVIEVDVQAASAPASAPARGGGRFPYIRRRPPSRSAWAPEAQPRRIASASPGPRGSRRSAKVRPARRATVTRAAST